jgi:hypothetical protein
VWVGDEQIVYRFTCRKFLQYQLDRDARAPHYK